MSRLLYALEDHFESVADMRQGQISARWFRGLSNFFAVAGDLWKADVGARRPTARSRATASVA